MAADNGEVIGVIIRPLGLADDLLIPAAVVIISAVLLLLFRRTARSRSSLLAVLALVAVAGALLHG